LFFKIFFSLIANLCLCIVFKLLVWPPQGELPLVGNAAPDFEAEAVFDQEFIKVHCHRPKQIWKLILHGLKCFYLIMKLFLFIAFGNFHIFLAFVIPGQTLWVYREEVCYPLFLPIGLHLCLSNRLVSQGYLVPLLIFFP
jgi:hypothetical protein